MSSRLSFAWKSTVWRQIGRFSTSESSASVSPGPLRQFFRRPQVRAFAWATALISAPIGFIYAKTSETIDDLNVLLLSSLASVQSSPSELFGRLNRVADCLQLTAVSSLVDWPSLILARASGPRLHADLPLLAALDHPDANIRDGARQVWLQLLRTKAELIPWPLLPRMSILPLFS